MENLLLPSKIEFKEGDTKNKGILEVSPCYFGYGTTLGNAIRRVLLSSLPGSAVEAFKIRGVQHEFTTVDGIKEDVVEIMLNLKQLIVNVHTDEPVILNISKKGPGVVTGADIEKNANVEVVNPEQILCNLTNSKDFEMEIIVGRGRGFKTTEEKDRTNFDLGTIVVDSIYTPIRDVGYSVEYTRVGDVTNFEKLLVNIETNGTVSPKDAVLMAVQILMDHFQVILGENQTILAEENINKTEESIDESLADTTSEEVEEEVVEDDEAPKKKASRKKSK